MAQTARQPQGELKQARLARGKLALDWLAPHAAPLAALTLLTVLALLLAYLVRPTVAIDLGDYYDRAFVSGFHDPEISGIGQPVRVEWPAGAREVQLQSVREGAWLITIRLADQFDPDRLRQALDFRANGVGLGFQREPEGSLLRGQIAAHVLDGSALRLELRSEQIDGQPVRVREVELVQARTYRWSTERGALSVPNLGAGSWELRLQITAAHPDRVPVGASLQAAEQVLAQLPEGQPRVVALLLPPEALTNGSIELALLAERTYSDPREIGVLLDNVLIAPAGPTPLLPPLGALLQALGLALAVYLALVVLQLPRWLALLGTALLVGLLALGLAYARYPVGQMLPGLLLLALLSGPLLLLLRRLLGWVFRIAGTPATPGFLNLLLLVFLLTSWIKLGGMLFPYFIGIDVRWHMDRVGWILDGRLPLLYGINSPLNESTMPVDEWGPNRPLIPYSPWFHMLATIFYFSPISAVLTANLASALLDGTRLLLIALIARRGSLSERGALLASLVYAVLPCTYLLHSWGNLPTSFGLWWTLAASAMIMAGYGRLQQRGPLVLLSVLFLGALLVYTVAGVFMGVFTLLFLGLLLRWGPAGRTGQARAIAIAGAVALLLAIMIYYGQYILPIIERTLPYLASSLGSGGEAVGRVSDSWPVYLARHVRLWNYGLVPPLLLSLGYLALAWRQPEGRLLYLMVAAWIGTMLLFIPLGRSVSLVDKHFWVAMPMLCIASAWVLERSWQRLPVRLLAAAGYGALAVSALSLWIYRVINVQQ